MNKSRANQLKKDFSQFSSSVCNDFDEPNEFYVRVYSKDDNSQYLIKSKGHLDELYIIAVGLGENGIGFEKIECNILDLKNEYLKVQ